MEPDTFYSAETAGWDGTDESASTSIHWIIHMKLQTFKNVWELWHILGNSHMLCVFVLISVLYP